MLRLVINCGSSVQYTVDSMIAYHRLDSHLLTHGKTSQFAASLTTLPAGQQQQQQCSGG
jgi:hypothetical protein